MLLWITSTRDDGVVLEEEEEEVIFQNKHQGIIYAKYIFEPNFVT